MDLGLKESMSMSCFGGSSSDEFRILAHDGLSLDLAVASRRPLGGAFNWNSSCSAAALGAF